MGFIWAVISWKGFRSLRPVREERSTARKIATRKMALTVRSRGRESRKKTEKGILSVRYQSVPERRPVITTS